MPTYGYARVSTADQDPQLQTDALAKAGVQTENRKHFYIDRGVSGSVPSRERPQLSALLERVDAGDKLIVWKLDRLGRNTLDVLSVLQELTDKGVQFESVTEKLDTSGPMGRAMVTILAAFAQLERDLIHERTMAGLAAAKAKGKLGGRPRVTADDPRVKRAAALRGRGFTVEETAHQMGLGVATVYRLLKLGREAVGEPVG
ncbi:recombinase family protein [Sinomonas albida]|uniref:recombinase family protein n=1 Tax=Sinomonas albida TaxID=369942 RepID=UPI00301717C1